MKGRTSDLYHIQCMFPGVGWGGAGVSSWGKGRVVPLPLLKLILWGGGEGAWALSLYWCKDDCLLHREHGTIMQYETSQLLFEAASFGKCCHHLILGFFSPLVV